MKINEVKIEFDREFFQPGEKVTGKIIVKTHDDYWSNVGRVFVKFYDRLNIEWVEEEIVIGDNTRVFSNFKRPYEINFETLFDSKHVIVKGKENDDFLFLYPFEFQLPESLQGTKNIRNAKCQYFIKAYLSHDDDTVKHYKNGVNVFDEFFRSLNHTYLKQEVIIRNPLISISPNLSDKHVFEAKSNNLNVTVMLPKLTYHRDETIQIHVHVENADNKNETALSLHKIGFKFFQVLKLTSKTPSERIRLFENLIKHSSRKNIYQNTSKGIEIEEYIQIPKDLPSSSSRSDVDRTKKNPIRINYKVSIEIWKSLFFDELHVNIPILVDPEA